MGEGTICRRTLSNKTTKAPNPFNLLWKAWDAFWKRTSISGINNAGSSASGFRRWIWMVIFVLFIALTFTGLKDVIDEFWSYPVLTSVTVKHHNQVHKISLALHSSLFNGYSSKKFK